MTSPEMPRQRARRRPAQPPHPDTLEAALPHYNSAFRRRYRLPHVTAAALGGSVDGPEWTEQIELARADGVVDASCALIARLVLSTVDRYAIGFADASGHVTAFDLSPAGEGSYLGRHVLLVNPLGGRDNWRAAAGWFRTHAGDMARRSELAGLASERRPDEPANRELLDLAAAQHERAVVLPPDEGFSLRRATEVAFIYGVSLETLRSWRRTVRADLSGRKVGAPRRNR